MNGHDARPAIERFIQAYISCMLWASTDDDGESMDGLYDDTDLSPEALAELRVDCENFYREHEDILSADPGRAGADFFLSRNGHGAGFFDGDWGDAGNALQEAAKVYGTSEPYVGDDGKLYLGG